jgi:phosphomethylpyrimidine synthase
VGSSGGATGTEIEEGMASMSKKFIDMGAQVYFEAERLKEGNEAL